MPSMGGSEWVDPDDHPTANPGTGKRKLTNAEKEDLAEKLNDLIDRVPEEDE